MRYIALIALLSSYFLISGCASTINGVPSVANTTSMNTGELLKVSKESSQRAAAAKSREEKETWALHGISVAEQCLMREPEEAGCYYYRAINTGLYYEAHIIGYQKGVKQMIDDCMNVIKFDPKYDHGGAYRILGQLYTKLPETTGRPEGITRDLEKAEGYLKKALYINPDYPENQLMLAETLYEKERVEEARKALLSAQEFLPRWQNDNAYLSWKTSMDKLEKKIEKSN